MILLTRTCSICGSPYKIEFDLADGPDAHQCIDCVGFELRPPRPQRAAARQQSEPTTQRTLFAGLHCLPGQQDLFETDGG